MSEFQFGIILVSNLLPLPRTAPSATVSVVLEIGVILVVGETALFAALEVIISLILSLLQASWAELLFFGFGQDFT